MNIGEAARRSGLPAKTIRYYEEIGLVMPARRDNEYRDYGEVELHELSFIAGARSLGFTIDQVRHLLALYRDKDRASADVRAAARAHVENIQDKIAKLKAMERTLATLIDSCGGDQRPECPILDGLARPNSTNRPTSVRS